MLRSSLSVFIFIIFSVAMLAAQVSHNQDIPVKNWPAPLYWQAPAAGMDGVPRKASAGLPRSTGSPASLIFVAMTPCRVVDTRASSGFPSPFGTPSMSAGVVRSFPVQSNTTCPIPTNILQSYVQAYSFNVTVVPPGPVGYLILWPQGQSQPNAVTLDDITGDIRNNAAIIPAGSPSGGISAVVNATTDLVIDINGYYVTPSDVTENTALGFDALIRNSTGSANTALGYGALLNNTSGGQNTAAGFIALSSNTTGSNNTAIGSQALFSNTTGGSNTAIGSQALAYNTTGSANIAIGYQAGLAITTENNNIDIGNAGVAGDNGVIRIGSGSQTSFYLRNTVAGVTVSNPAELVINTSTGQLGTVSSSRRYKKDIRDMSDASSGLLQLRPITFRYRNPYADGSKPLDYGLIAEEVAEAYPELISRNAAGQIETVQYHKLIPMLLNELQKEHTGLEQDHETVDSLSRTVDTLQAQAAALQKTLEALLAGKAQ